MKNNRQYMILKLIKEMPIDTQEQLASALKDHGFNVTQATVSRDIKELKLVKIQDGNIYKYAAVEKENREMGTGKYKNILKDAVISVNCAMNIVVIKCHVGMANAACVALDYIMSIDSVGAIAGDDTIFVAMSSPEKALSYQSELKKYL